MCRKKQHVRIDDMKKMPDLICGKVAVGGNYNSTHDKMTASEVAEICNITTSTFYRRHKKLKNDMEKEA